MNTDIQGSSAIDEARIEEILSGAEYFMCQKTRTRMKKAACIERQKGVKKAAGYGHYQLVPVECQDCQQGKLIADSSQQGKEKQDSSKLKAESREEREMEGKKTCIESGCEETDIKARGRCRPHYNAWYSKEQRKAGGQSLKDRGIGHGDELPGQDRLNAVTLNFEEYPDVLEALEALAKDELRPLDMQAMYLIKQQLILVGNDK